ncbi:O-antigen ligase family protein [Francisella adeliensis]|nr:O-antigen ligase family protein [Francisella adeliensis]
MTTLTKKISLRDIIFAFLCISLFIVFLMPFEPFISLNLVDISSGSGKKFLNDLTSANIGLFIHRYYIFYYSLCISSLAILLNKKILFDVIDYFKGFSRVVKSGILLFFTFGVISSCFAFSPSIAIKGVGLTFLQFINVLFVARYIQEKQYGVEIFYKIVMLSLIFFGGTLALRLWLSNYSVYGSVVAGNIQKVLLYLYNCLNPRFLDNYFSWFLPLLLLPWFVDMRPIYKIGSFIAITVVWFVLINHAFRTIYAEYMVILPLLFIYSKKYFKVTVTVFVLAFSLAYLIDYAYTSYILSSGTSQVSTLMRYGTSGRLSLWHEAFLIGLNHPLTGIGQWNYLVYTKYSAGYPHNLLLEIWSQWGIPAFIGAAAVILVSIKNLFKQRVEICANPLHCIFIMMFTAGMIDGMLNAMFKTSLGLFGSVFVFGFCLSMFKSKSLSSVKDNSSTLDVILTTVLVLGSIFCITILPLIFKPMWI